MATAWVAVAGVAGVTFGWVASHVVLAATGYDGDPSRGAAITGAIICGGAALGTAAWLTRRRGVR